jgi:outer membrane protein OmpA-like peptidoglycan-associated protein
MLLGIPETATNILKATLNHLASKAALVMAGLNKGVQISASLIGSLGHVWAEVLQEPAPKLDVPSEEPTSTKHRNHATVTLAGDVLFDFDKDTLGTKAHPADALAVLMRAGSIVKYVKDMPDSRVRIEGHTASIRPVKYNLDLSTRRAATVAQWLIRNGYAPASQVSWKGYGQSRPVASNHDEAGRAKTAGSRYLSMPRAWNGISG